MISFDLLSKDDLMVLLEGFTPAFLQAPFAKPYQPLERFIPKGFRPDRLTRQQQVKVFVDAISKGEPSICAFVKNEIEKNFDNEGISALIEEKRGDENYLYGEGVVDFSALLWERQLRVPVYVVYLLCGVSCSEQFVNASMKLHSAFYSAIDSSGKEWYEKGKKKGEEKALEAEKDADKRIAKLIKNCEDERKRTDKAQQLVREVSEERDSIKDALEISESKVTEANDEIDLLNKRLSIQASDIRRYKDELLKKKDCSDELKDAKNSLKNKDREIEQLRETLSKAANLAFSDDVLRRMVSDVLDELKAVSPERQEILRIARKRFSESDSVLDSWLRLSEESNDLISKTIEEFDSGHFSLEHLDTLEQVEDGILIRYAVAKSLKAVLYNALEKKDSEDTLNKRFSGYEDD